MKAVTLFRLAVVFGALALASGARAQGDVDFLTTSVPPNVVIQFDTSGSMRAIILPQEYKDARGAPGSGQTWFRSSNDAAGQPASYVDPAYCKSGDNWTYCTDGVNYERTCAWYRNGSAWSRCQAGTSTCYDDSEDNLTSFPGWTTDTYELRCWLPAGEQGEDFCANAPGGFSCSHESDQSRLRQDGTSDTRDTVRLGLPNYSYTATTLIPPNYVWWILQQLYLDNVPVPVIQQDRNAAAKAAIRQVIDATNPDGQQARVKFGLARYSSSNNGGYVVVPPSLNNRTTLLGSGGTPGMLDQMPASGGTPLSETLVDVGRYFAGEDQLGTYPVYNRSTTGGTLTDPNQFLPSPIDNGCEKNFVIVVTDGMPTSDCNDHHGSAFTDTFGSMTDACTGALDDVAEYLHDRDLRSDMIGLQNVFTYTVGFNVDATLLQDTADLGGGRYYNTTNADDLAASLIDAVLEILQRNTSFSSATVPSTRTAFGDGFYTAYFTPGGGKGVWRGHLEAYRLSPSLDVLDRFGNIALDPVTDQFIEPRQPFWDADDTVRAQVGSRNLFTTRAGVECDPDLFCRRAFTAADPSDPNQPTNATQLGVTIAEENFYPHYVNDPNVIDTVAPLGTRTDEDLADAIVNYVHGFDSFDEDEDGNVNEAREWVFGDIFHSNPVAIGPALPFLRNETGYGPVTDPTSFMARYRYRQRVLYTGANDGMLHAFDAGSLVDPDPNSPGDEYYSGGTGAELFGYVPGFLLSRIKAVPQANPGKQFYVDGSGSAADVFIDYDGDGVREGTDWTTALLTPMRQGGEGVLALDVTDPNATTGNHGPYPRLMWEFTHSDLGETWSRPIITRVKMRATTGTGDRCGVNDGDGDCMEEWVAIFGAGYRVEGDPNLAEYTNDPNSVSYTTKGRGVYIVRISDGTVLSRLRQIPADAIFQRMRFAIPAEPAVLDTDFDGFADVIYIGDLGGQLWKWDISTVGTLSSGTVPTTVWPANVLFEAPVATIAGGQLHYHSIFQSAAAAYVNNTLTLSFASGERTDMGYIGEADPNDPNDLIGLYDDNNRFWVLKDTAPTGAGAFPSDLPVMEAGAAGATGHPTLTDITLIPEDNDPSDAGYFFRVQDGEKFISNHLIFGGVTITLSYLPNELAEDPEVAPGEEAEVCVISGQTNQWAWDLSSGGGTLTDPDDANATVRSLVLGNGAPTDPRLTISKDNNGNLVIKITAQTSTGAIANPEPPPNTLDLVDLIYWRQNF